MALLCTPLVLVMLRRFERRTRLAMEALDIAGDGFRIADEQGHLLEVSHGCVQITGYTRYQLQSMSFAELQAPQLQAGLAAQLAAGLCEVDEQGRCTSINPAALKMLDREGVAEELIGAPVHELLHAQPPLQPRTGPVACPACEAHRAGKPLHLQGRLLRRFDGSTIDVAYSSQPVFEGDQRRASIDTFMETGAAAS